MNKETKFHKPCLPISKSLNILAQASEYDLVLARKWASQDDGSGNFDRSTGLSVRIDALNKLEKSGKSVSALKDIWNTLNVFTHATIFAQQHLRITPSDRAEVDKMFASQHFFEQTDYTLGLLLTLLTMNFHLIARHFGPKAHGWYFGYRRDPEHTYERETEIKDECKN